MHLTTHVLVLAVSQQIHVILAHSDLRVVLAKARDEVHVELSTRILLGGLRHHLLTLSRLLLLLHLLGLGLAVTTGATAHDAFDGLVSDLRTGTECHTRHHHTTHARHHSAASLLWLLHRSRLTPRGRPGRRSRGTGGRASRKESAAAT